MTTPTILVFGSTGAIGGELIQRLLPAHSEGTVRIVATARTTEAAAGFEHHGIECRLLDLDHAEHRGLDPLVSALSGIDRVFLMTSYDVKMLAQSKAVIDASKQADVSYILHLGAHASPATTIVHLGWHQMIEAYLSIGGLSHTNLHPTSFMQNLLMLWALAGSPPGVLPHYIGDARTSWVDSDDVADAAAVILRDPEPHAGRSYLLGAEVASMREMIAELSVATGALWREDQREPADFFQAVTAAGADPMYMGCVRTIFERTRNGTLPDLAETSETLSRLTQRPATSIRSFLERHRDHFTTDSAQGRA